MNPSPLVSVPVDRKKIRILEGKSILYRKTLLKMIYTAKAGHTGGSLSCVDILNVLYNHVMNITGYNRAACISCNGCFSLMIQGETSGGFTTRK